MKSISAVKANPVEGKSALALRPKQGGTSQMRLRSLKSSLRAGKPLQPVICRTCEKKQQLGEQCSRCGSRKPPFDGWARDQGWDAKTFDPPCLPVEAVQPRIRLDISGGVVPIVPLKDLERWAIQNAIAQCDSPTAAARALGLGHTTIHRKLQKYGITVKPPAVQNGHSEDKITVPQLSD